MAQVWSLHYLRLNAKARWGVASRALVAAHPCAAPALALFRENEVLKQPSVAGPKKSRSLAATPQRAFALSSRLVDFMARGTRTVRGSLLGRRSVVRCRGAFRRRAFR